MAASFYQTITDAINDLAAHGYDSAQRVAYWQDRIREAAQRTMTPADVMERALRDALARIYKRLVDNGQVLDFHQGVGRFTLERIRPALRAELDRRIMASADLIRLNRRKAIDQTLARFAGWSTSIPPGGLAPGSKPEAKATIRKALAQLPFEERRVLIDQGHKLRASISEVIAQGGDAIAMIWHSHWRQPGYNYRPDHKERDQLVYLMRGNWATAAGLVKAGPAGYYDQVTSVAEEPFCRCYAQWVYAISDLPSDMLTAKGAKSLADARAAIAAMKVAA